MSQVTTNGLSYLETVEEHFQAARGTGFFRLSPLDWALAEAWQQSGIPIEAVLRGIDRTFENWWKRPARARTEKVNSIAYCAQAISAEAQAMANVTPIARHASAPPFSLDDVGAFVSKNAAALRAAGDDDLAASLESMDLAGLYLDLEQLEQRLTAIEEKLLARLRAAASEDALLEIRRALDRELKPYRGNMSAEQLAMLEKQFLDRKLLESAGLPRLSLFYL